MYRNDKFFQFSFWCIRIYNFAICSNIMTEIQMVWQPRQLLNFQVRNNDDLAMVCFDGTSYYKRQVVGICEEVREEISRF